MISTSDFHLSEYKPRARKDNYLKAQFDKFDFIANYAKNDDGIWTHSGDLFDLPKPSLFFMRKVIKKFRAYNIIPYVIPGQHDLPLHSLKDINSTGLGVLAAADAIHLILNTEPIEIGYNKWLYGVPFGMKPIKPKTDGFNILLLHELILEDKPEWPGQSSRNALKVLKEHKYDLIISGDNHKFFIREYKGRTLINPGSIMRKNISQTEHEPRIFWTNFEDYQMVAIPHEKDVFDFTEKDTLVEDYSSSFVSLLDDETEIEDSFINNLNIFLDKNDIEIDVKNKTMEFTSE